MLEEGAGHQSQVHSDGRLRRRLQKRVRAAASGKAREALTLDLVLSSPTGTGHRAPSVCQASELV